MDTPNTTIDREALRLEIQTAIAAGREFDPSMDKHLADSVIDRYLSSQPRLPQVPDLPDERLTASDVVLRGAALLLSASVIIAMIVASTWWMYWLILPIMGILMAIFRGKGRGQRERRRESDPALKEHYRAERRQYQESQMRYQIAKMEAKRAKMEAKRAFVNGFLRGFDSPESNH